MYPSLRSLWFLTCPIRVCRSGTGLQSYHLCEIQPSSSVCLRGLFCWWLPLHLRLCPIPLRTGPYSRPTGIIDVTREAAHSGRREGECDQHELDHELLINVWTNNDIETDYPSGNSTFWIQSQTTWFYVTLWHDGTSSYMEVEFALDSSVSTGLYGTQWIRASGMRSKLRVHACNL